MAQSLINRDFVKAARYMGAPFKIVMRHLVPNIGSLLVLNFTSGIMSAVLSEVAYPSSASVLSTPTTRWAR